MWCWLVRRTRRHEKRLQQIGLTLHYLEIFQNIVQHKYWMRRVSPVVMRWTLLLGDRHARPSLPLVRVEGSATPVVMFFYNILILLSLFVPDMP